MGCMNTLSLMNPRLSAPCLLVLWGLQHPVATAATAPMADTHAQVVQTVRQFIQAQTAGYPGEVVIQIQPLDARIKVAACEQIEAFSLPSSRLWGKSHVGVRCLQLTPPAATTPWTLYVQADIQVWGEYAVLATPVSQGSRLSADMVNMQRGDLSKVPSGVVTERALLEGKQAIMNMPLGTVLRPEMLKALPVVLQGQTVQVVSRGDGFVVSTDGMAMQAAAVGQLVDVKVSSGQTVKGIAKASGKVEVPF